MNNITQHDINTSLVTDHLTNEELLQIAAALLFEDDPRTLTVYPKCQDLFTDGGVRMHRLTYEAFHRIIVKRLEQEEEKHA